MVKACESQRRLGHRSVRRCLTATYSPDPFTLDPLGVETTSRAGDPLAIAEGSDAFGAR
jgi:hypothetical protein